MVTETDTGRRGRARWARMLALGALAAAACGPAERLDLRVTGADFDHWAWADGKLVWARPFRGEAAATAAGATQQARILGGAFSFVWPAALAPGMPHVLLYAIDGDADSTCGPGDGGFRVAVAPAHADVEVALAPQDPAAATDLCASLP